LVQYQGEMGWGTPLKMRLSEQAMGQMRTTFAFHLGTGFQIRKKKAKHGTTQKGAPATKAG